MKTITSLFAPLFFVSAASLLGMHSFAQNLERNDSGWRVPDGEEPGISQNGKFILAGGGDSPTPRQLWREEDGVLLGTVAAAEKHPRLALLPGDGKSVICFSPLAVAYSDGSGADPKIPVFLHRRAVGGASGVTVGVPATACPLAVESSGKLVAISAGAGNSREQAWVVNVDVDKKVQLAGAVGDPQFADGASFSPDGSRLVLSRSMIGGTTRVWDTASGAKVLDLPWPAKQSNTRRLLFPPPQFAATWSADGGSVAAIGNAGVAVWRVSSPNKGVWLRAAADDLILVALSPDGSHVYAATEGGALMHWQVGAGGYGKLTPTGADRISAMAVSADGKHLLTGGVEPFRPASGSSPATAAGSYIRKWILPTLAPASPSQAPEPTAAITRAVEFREALDKAQFGSKRRALPGLAGAVAFFLNDKNPLEQEYLDWLPKDVQALAARDASDVRYLVIFEERRLAAGAATYATAGGGSETYWGHQPQWRFRIVPLNTPAQGIESEWMTGSKPKFPKTITKPPLGQQTKAEMLNHVIGEGPLNQTSAFFRQCGGAK
jgi:WD40 repeat protein